MTELNALRSTTIDLYVRAMSNFTAFFRTVPLQPNEQACYIHTFRNPVNVRYMGQDGGPRTAKAVKAQRQLFIDMRELTTDEVGYQIRDINLGTDVASAAQATVDIGWDMANKVDLEAYTLMTAGQIDYGARHLRPVQPHRRAAGPAPGFPTTASFPTTCRTPTNWCWTTTATATARAISSGWR